MMHSLRLRRGQRKLAVLATAAGLLLAAGCGSGGDEPADEEGGSGTPQSGGTLIFDVSSDQGCVDPQQTVSADSLTVVRQLADSLTDQDPTTGEIVPWLAESWEISADSKTYTFTLRDDVTFSDGTPLTADVVKKNFDTIPDLGARAQLGIGYLAGYAESVAEDEHTLTVTFDQPNAQFLQATSTPSMGIVAESMTTESPDDRCLEVVASGPFVLDEYKPAAVTKMSKRDGYDWASSLAKHQGEAYLDHLEFQVVPETGVRTGNLQSGQADVISNIGPQDEAALRPNGDIGLEAVLNPGMSLSILINQSNETLLDPAVRQAISMAVNRQDIVDAAYQSTAKPATSILSSVTPYYVDHSADLGFDSDAAMSLLEDAGWAMGSDGIFAKGSKKLSLDMIWLTNYPTNQAAVTLLQQQLKTAGIDLVLRQTDVADATPILTAGTFDMFWGNTTRADPDILRNQMSTAGANFFRFPEEAPLNEALLEQAGLSDTAARADEWATIQEEIVTNYLLIPVVEQTTMIGHSASTHDVGFNAEARNLLYDTWKS